MLDQIIKNLLKTCDPNLNNEERRQNFLILDDYQTQLFQIEHLKTFLCSSSDPQVKIFGLKCLENFILYKWNIADKITTRGYLIEIIKEYNNFNVDNESERVIRWIIAKSVMYFIRHECPQNCDSIITDLINLKGNGLMTQALVLSIFYCLSECLPIDSQMPDKRKKEVIGYLTENYENIIQFSLEILKTSNNDWNSLNIKLESVKTIQSFSGWIKFESLGKLADEIFTVLIQCLNVSNCDYFIMETIETILDRKTRVEDKCFMLNVLINNEPNWYKLLINIEIGLQLGINPYSDEKFRYLQKIMDLLLAIGSIFINCWMKFSENSRNVCFDKFINCIQMATAHPVEVLAIELLSFWYNGFKIDCENLRMTLSSKANFLLPLLKHYSMKPSIRNPNNIDHEYLVNLIEQKDEENYVNRIRYEASRAISTLTEHFTQGIIALCLDMVYSAILDIQQIGESLYLQLSVDNMRQLEASRFFCRSVLHSVFRPYSKNLHDQVKTIFGSYPNEIIMKGKNIITSILQFDNSNADIVMIYIDLLCLLIPFIADQEVIVKECLEKIFLWFHIHESVDPKHLHYGLWRQVNKNCGVWILRVFRDYHFLITPSLFENILVYYRSKCRKLYENPIIVEAMTIYICSSSNYTVSQQESIFAQFINDIKSVLLSQSCVEIFENGSSVVNYLQLNSPAPVNELSSVANQDFRNGVVQAVTCLYGICCRISSTETDNNVVNTKSPETISIIACPLYEHIMDLLPSLLKIIRAINQIWSSNDVHADFSSLKEISDYYKDTIINNKPAEKIHPNNSQSFAQIYVNSCRNFISRLHESIWLILAKCCLNYSGHLYSIKEWPQSIIEYVFSDLDSLPNFKLNPLIKSFVIPFVSHCPLDRFEEVMSLTALPFINYTFQRLHEKWSTIETDSVVMDDADFDINLDEQTNEGNSELCNEIIEEQVLRMLTKSFCELIRLTFAMGSHFGDDAGKGFKFGVIIDRLFQKSPNESSPIILMILNNVCRSITWKDSFCCAKLSLLIQPIVNEIHSRGLMSIEIVIFIFQQLICALNLFSSGNFVEIKVSLLNLGVGLYDEYIANNSQSSNKFFSLLDKSSEQAITTFQTKMTGKLSLKVKRDVLEKLLQPYIRVSINKLFSQEVFIKDLPPLLKPHWKTIGKMSSINDTEDPLCLEHLFRN